MSFIEHLRCCLTDRRVRQLREGAFPTEISLTASSRCCYRHSNSAADDDVGIAWPSCAKTAYKTPWTDVLLDVVLLLAVKLTEKSDSSNFVRFVKC